MVALTVPVEVGAGPADADPILDFETWIIPHDTLTQAKLAISRLHARYRPKGKRRLKARALIIAGPSGSGKTTIVESYASDYPQVTDGPDGDVRRVVVVECPSKPTQRSFVATIMRGLGYNARDTWNTDEIIAKIGFLCDALKTELIIIDEAHHVTDHVKQENEEEVSEFLKSLLNRINTQVVLVGMPALTHLRDYPQLRRRISPPVLLEPYRWDTIEGRASFGAMLALFEGSLALPEPSLLWETDAAMRIYCATGGHPGLVAGILSHALTLAEERKLRRLDLKLLAEVWRAFNPMKPPKLDVDPFAQPKPQIKLVADATKNPFEAKRSDFLKLWARMVENQDAMAAMANRRRPRQLDYRPVGDNIQARLAA